MAGKSLKDRELDRQIRSSMHALDTPKVDTRIWDRLAANVLRTGPAAISRALEQKIYPVPNVSGAQDQRCQLTSYPVGRRFREDTQLNTLVADLFEGIAKGVLAASLPPVELTRWDLFHAHIFFTPQDRGIGLLFHAKEYPRQCEAFPYNLGYCQRGSPLEFHERGMDFRNLLYFQGELCCLDVGEDSVLHNTLIMDGLQDVRTVLEMDFGEAIGDVNYFGSLEVVDREDKLFVCGNFSDIIDAGLETERT
ncbi:hypothetical protein COCOBI_04-0880 [Coccomyxa sp. Obi]|nr:hypothetical protein COCOBI_04-0880 [Coccomyxa sp. Obi]